MAENHWNSLTWTSLKYEQNWAMILLPKHHSSVCHSESSTYSSRFRHDVLFNGLVQGKIYRKTPWSSWENLWFPIGFPLNQSIDLWFSMIFFDFLWFSMIFFDFLWFSMIFYDFLWFLWCPARCSQVFSTKKTCSNPRLKFPSLQRFELRLELPQWVVASMVLWRTTWYLNIIWHWMMTYYDSSYLPSFHENSFGKISSQLFQGLVNVPFWGYWTSPKIVAIKKTIYLMVGWCSMGTFNAMAELNPTVDGRNPAPPWMVETL